VTTAAPAHPVRLAAAGDTNVVAELLDAFNREFDSPTPGPDVLATRLRKLVSSDDFAALLTGAPAVGVAAADTERRQRPNRNLTRPSLLR
jgi:hypothetical protein